MNFDLHDKVVHICRKDISGDMVDCIVIRLVAGRAGILLPFNSIQESGLRRVCSNEDMDEALTVLGNTAEDLSPRLAQAHRGSQGEGPFRRPQHDRNRSSRCSGPLIH